jgi:hypothetical protein
MINSRMGVGAVYKKEQFSYRDSVMPVHGGTP